jgi:hypothetical protein
MQAAVCEHMVSTAAGEGTRRLIAHERTRLDARLHELLQKEAALQRDRAILKHQCESLQKRCSHPRQQCSRRHGPYSERETHCPDCGRQVFG